MRSALFREDKAAIATNGQPKWRAGLGQEHRRHRRFEDTTVEIHAEFHKAFMPHKARARHDPARRCAVLRGWVRPTATAIKVDFHMLRAENNLDLGTIGMAGGQELPKGGIDQSTLHHPPESR